MNRATVVLAGILVLAACGGGDGDGRSDQAKARAVVERLEADGFYDDNPDVTDEPRKLASAFRENCELDDSALEYYVAQTIDDGDPWALEVARAYRAEFCPDRVEDLEDAVDYVTSL